MDRELLTILQADNFWVTSGSGTGIDEIMQGVTNLSQCPAVFVVPISANPQSIQDRPNAYSQIVEHTVAAMVAVVAVDDKTGSKASQAFAQSLSKLKQQLLGVKLATSRSVVRFQGMDLVDSSGGIAWYSTAWSADYLWQN